MAEAFDHTTGAQMEEFLGKSPSEQSLRIWLSARETNGHLADAKRDISSMGLEVQKTRLALSDHLTNHITPATLLKVEQMWTWFDRGKFLLTLGTIALLVQPTLIAIALWLLKSS